jgi:hypothetical protein
VDSGRRLSGDEVARILRLASEAEVPGMMASEGVTVPELVQAAREAGISPELVRRAAAVVEDPTSGLATTAFGAPDTRVLHAFHPGARLPEERDAVVRTVEGALQRRGQVQQNAPGRLVWKEDHTLGRTTVSLVQTSDGVELSVEADRAGHYLGAWFLGVLGWSLLAWLTPLGGLGVGAAIVGFLVAPFLLARPFWIRADRVRRRRLEAVTMGLLEAVEPADG